MSRALLTLAYAKAAGIEPTADECRKFIAALAELAGGDYLYIPKLPQAEADDTEICRLREAGASYRDIAATLHCSQATVARAIRQRSLLSVSPYDGSAEAA